MVQDRIGTRGKPPRPTFFRRAIDASARCAGRRLSTSDAADFHRSANTLPKVGIVGEPALQGIYAADTARLSASLVFGTRERPARRARKGLVAPARGVQQLIDALEWRLRTREVSIRLNTPARLDGSTPAVICTSACDAAEILRDVAPAASHGFTRATIRGRSHTLPRHVVSEAEHERVQAPCSRDFQLLAAAQV